MGGGQVKGAGKGEAAPKVAPLDEKTVIKLLQAVELKQKNPIKYAEFIEMRHYDTPAFDKMKEMLRECPTLDSRCFLLYGVFGKAELLKQLKPAETKSPKPEKK